MLSPHYCDRPEPLGEGVRWCCCCCWRGGAAPRLRLTGPEEASALDQASDSFTWLRGEREVVKKSPLLKGLRICRVCPDRMLLCSHTASHREDGKGGRAQIRDRLLTSVQGLATTFVGICFTMCGATHCWGGRGMQDGERIGLIFDQYIAAS